jgi:hypothetical protein
MLDVNSNARWNIIVSRDTDIALRHIYQAWRQNVFELISTYMTMEIK